MDKNMLGSIITSKTRIKLLSKFFLNSRINSYLRNLEQEFGESTNAIRVELNRLEYAGLLESEHHGNRKYFKANTNHPLFNDIHNILLKNYEIDKIKVYLISKIPYLKEAYLTGDIAEGRDTRIIDLALIGENMDINYINFLVDSIQRLIDRKIRLVILSSKQTQEYLSNNQTLSIWSHGFKKNEQTHIVKKKDNLKKSPTLNY